MVDTINVPETAPESVLNALVGHNLIAGLVHTNLTASQCACMEPITTPSPPRPQTGSPDGGVCFACGGFTVRTGSCTTCTTCGTSGGCG